MERYVVSRELAEKLKAAGYPQEIQHYHALHDSGEWFVYHRTEIDGDMICAAPLTDELLEQLPTSIPYETENHIRNKSPKLWKHDSGFSSGYSSFKTMSADKPADALAELWLWCKEQGYIK